MTPGARIAAAIEILDRIRDGEAAEQALTRWARRSRFAGSKDRAAIRDYVFYSLRNWRSDAVFGGGETGRARMIGRLRAQGTDADTVFDGEGHAPQPLTAAERAAGQAPTQRGDVWNLPDWLCLAFADSLGEHAEKTARLLAQRAPVTLRVNSARADVDVAQRDLERDGVSTIRNPRAATALTVTQGARRVRQTDAYQNGVVELQDASSQAAVLACSGSGRALDYCAGGGGKALALAALGWRATAHDVDVARMTDLPVRARRAGHDISLCTPGQLATAGAFDLVFVDAPCSGSGTWRRTPEAKWHLTPARLEHLKALQADVLRRAACHVRPGGMLVYATCSILRDENAAQAHAFLAKQQGWRLTAEHVWPVSEDGDGFFAAHLTREVD